MIRYRKLNKKYYLFELGFFYLFCITLVPFQYITLYILIVFSHRNIYLRMEQRKMKFAINGMFLTQQFSGVHRFAIELIKELDKIVEKRLYSDFS